MFRLKIISGPNSGKSFRLKDGETTIGRQSSNVIQLKSNRISKYHCVLTVNGEEVFLEDQNSANGTFLNGVMSETRQVTPGDRISVGEYVLELGELGEQEEKGKNRQKRKKEPDVGGADFSNLKLDSDFGNVVPLDRHSKSPVSESVPSLGTTNATGFTGVDPVRQGPPEDFKGKAAWYLEKILMPFFYGLNVKYEWRSICIGVFLAFILSALVISIYPLMQMSRQALIQETAQRAKFIAKQIADENAPALAAGQETKTKIGLAEEDSTVAFAILTDLDNRIIAPGSKMNQYLAAGTEAELAVKAAEAFKDGREQGVTRALKNGNLVSIQPVKVFDSRLGRNRVVAMAVVSLDTTLSTPDLGSIFLVYSNAFVLMALVALLLGFVLYRLTLKRFDLLNEDVDRVLRGEGNRLANDFKASEFNGLFEVVDAALQRIPRGGGDSAFDASSAPPGIDELVGAFSMLGESFERGLMVFDADKKVLYINPIFEEVSGIRLESAAGEDLQSVARDEAFLALCDDFVTQLQSGVEKITEDFDFGGVVYKIDAAMIGDGRGYVLMSTRDEA